MSEWARRVRSSSESLAKRDQEYNEWRKRVLSAARYKSGGERRRERLMEIAAESLGRPITDVKVLQYVLLAEWVGIALPPELRVAIERETQRVHQKRAEIKHYWIAKKAAKKADQVAVLSWRAPE